MTTTTVMDWSDACKASVADCNRPEGMHYGVRLPKHLTLHEITEEAYWWGLECVPPREMRSTAYLCGEPYSDDLATGKPVYSFGVQVGKRFFTCLMTVAQFGKLTKADVDLAIEWLDTDFTPG